MRIISNKKYIEGVVNLILINQLNFVKIIIDADRFNKVNVHGYILQQITIKNLCYDKGHSDLQHQAPFQQVIAIYQNSAPILYRPRAHWWDP